MRKTKRMRSLSGVGAKETCVAVWADEFSRISPGWRKDKFNKIFRKPFTKKVKTKMAKKGQFKELNPLIEEMKTKKEVSRRRREERDMDEAIGLDSEDLLSDEDGEDIQLSGSDPDEPPQRVHKAGRSLVADNEVDPDAKEPDRYLTSPEVFAYISDLFQQEREILGLVYGNQLTRKTKSVSADMFFLRAVLVPPNKFRPEAATGDREIAEAPENSQYKAILNASERLNQIRNEILGRTEPTGRRRNERDLQVAIIALQDAVNSLIDSDRNPVTGLAAKRKVDGVKQKLEKKEGLFRMNMMGKRVNFAARSVISPDPNIETNEVGVPPVFARKLTYPEPVTNHNFYELKQAVLNGVGKWPGAAAIENESGQVIDLRTKNYDERLALANQLLAPSSTTVTGARNKKVHRHLTNGDIVLMNRQPTLHKPSIMAHRARVLPGEKTIRMHYANCNTYNADFDGDEMNLHFPQNEIARSEALQIADTDHQYLVATSGKPLRGLIQDHISMGVWLTSRDTLFSRDDYHQLLCSCLRPENNHTQTSKIETIAPAILKPRPFWTGKQVITTILKNITPASHPGLTFNGRSQTSDDQWGQDSQEGEVCFVDSYFICGILDKAQIGPTGKGFIHSVYEAYGHTIAGRLLSVLGRLLTKFLNMRAFTCGLDDLRLTTQGDAERQLKLADTNTIGIEVASSYVSLDPKSSPHEIANRLEDVLRDDVKQSGLDGVYNTRTVKLSSDVTRACLPVGLRKPFPFNQMQTMTTSGAKGSNVNANQISCNLGQQFLEGRRVPIMVSGKSLPSFKPFETKVRAGGYVSGRFLTGIRPQEYYFHAMAGREGLIDTAVKTSRSGYLQRCLIKGMEGLRSEYDTSVRDADGSVIQFLYGEDGLDVTKQKHLTDFKFMTENYLSLVAELNIASPEFWRLKDQNAESYHKKAMKKYQKSGRLDAMDPVLAVYNPGSVIGSTSEAFACALNEYCERNPDGVIKDKIKAPNAAINKKTLTALLNVKYMKSTIEPGEAVGVVAGQSIGEPSTQMTLNTFHLAGHAAKNVTAGIPRLREIVMTASRVISTPTMTLHLIPELSDDDGKRFAKAISKISVADVIDEVQIVEKTGPGVGYKKAKIYDVRLQFFPAKEYCDEYAIEAGDLKRAIVGELVPLMEAAIKKELKRKGDARYLKDTAAQPAIGKSARKTDDASAEVEGEVEEIENEINDDEEDDDDAKESRRKRNQEEATTYEAPDEGEEAITDAGRRATSPSGEEPEDEGFGGSPAPSQDNGDFNGEEEEKKRQQRVEHLESMVKDRCQSVSRFAFDAEKAEWCDIRFEFDISAAKVLLLPLVENACREALIHHIQHLGDCTFTKEDSPVVGEKKTFPVVLTQGVNLQAMREYQHIINPHKIFTNDIAAMLAVYGIEACRATIIREMDAIFKGHGIAVDMRHLNLIADMMTRSGGFAAFNRTAMRDAVSPFMKMSFETTTNFVRDAVLEGDTDDLTNPSARIVAGKVGNIGTGAFDVLMPLR